MCYSYYRLRPFEKITNMSNTYMSAIVDLIVLNFIVECVCWVSKANFREHRSIWSNGCVCILKPENDYLIFSISTFHEYINGCKIRKIQNVTK